MPGSAAMRSSAPSSGDQKLRRREIDDAAEAADIVGSLDGEPPEGEVGEVGIEGGFRVAGEKPAPRSLVRGLLRSAVDRHPRPLQGIALGAGAVEQDGGPRVLREVPSVLGEA